ncbi:MAG TPA: TraB/GumN family protein [Chitinophagaceae bacterium]|nr:TraB/GumN family protein [Chitinophagaceae bacterium]
MFAVGAGHLVGEQGLISLLRAQGYTLTPLPNTWK